jgi:matrix metalloproteinase-16 (membrane-inserted)
LLVLLGKTYFFKGKGFWKFNDLRMRVENEQQTPSAPFWMGCPRELERPTEPGDVLPPKEELDIKPPPSESTIASLCSVTLLTVLTFHFMVTLSCQL